MSFIPAAILPAVIAAGTAVATTGLSLALAPKAPKQVIARAPIGARSSTALADTVARRTGTRDNQRTGAGGAEYLGRQGQARPVGHTQGDGRG